MNNRVGGDIVFGYTAGDHRGGGHIEIAGDFGNDARGADADEIAKRSFVKSERNVFEFPAEFAVNGNADDDNNQFGRSGQYGAKGGTRNTKAGSAEAAPRPTAPRPRRACAPSSPATRPPRC